MSVSVFGFAATAPAPFSPGFERSDIAANALGFLIKLEEVVRLVRPQSCAGMDAIAVIMPAAKEALSQLLRLIDKRIELGFRIINRFRDHGALSG